jgi:hypothetical protein
MLQGVVGGIRRRWGLVLAVCTAMTLGACSAYDSIASFGADLVLPTGDDVSETNFQSFDAVEAAYGNVVAGETRLPELATLGFDAANAPNVEKLSYLGVMDRFMPGSSLKFDHLALPVQNCIEAQERCSAFVFRPARIHSKRTGNVLLDMLGFDRLTIEAGWSAEVIFLMQDGRVVYKVLQGKPRIQEVHERISPLGPLQDIGGTAVGFAGKMKM